MKDKRRNIRSARARPYANDQPDPQPEENRTAYDGKQRIGISKRVTANALAAAASAFFIIPNNFVMGGTTGIGIFVRNLLDNNIRKYWRYRR